MTLNGIMAVILRYFSEFDSFRGALRKSSRSLSHLLMSSCYYLVILQCFISTYAFYDLNVFAALLINFTD